MPPSRKKDIDLPQPTFTLIKLPAENSDVRVLSKLPEELVLDKEGFNDLWSMIPEKPSSVVCFGKKFFTKRQFQSFGKDYHFSQETHEADPIEHPFLKKILKWVQEHSGKPFNQILVNWYCDGSASIGPHADDERQLEKGSSIYSFSFGQKRDFVITKKKGKGEGKKTSTFRHSISMPDNSLIIMDGDTQKHFLHSVPPRSTKICPGKRINVTVRWFKYQEEQKKIQ